MLAQLIEFVGNHLALVALFIALAVALAVHVVRDLTSEAQVAPQEAVNRINREGARVVDIRSKEQFAKGHIIDSVNVPLADLSVDRLKAVRDCPLLLVCESGQQSALAHKKLVEWPKPVVRLRGGLAAWRNESLPVSKPGKRK